MLGPADEEKGHDFFVQFTDARADTGGLSGATPSEAVSWGKVDPDRLPDTLVCYTDPTIALPLLTAYALANHKPRKSKRLYERRGEFTLRVPEFCVCVALVEDGRPVVAVEYNPATDQMFAAVRGGGTTLNGAPARVSTQTRVADAVVLASRSEYKRGEWDPFKPRCRVVLTGSVAFKLAELSRGAGDSTFTLTPKNEWDICAGTLLVEEAGGRVTGLQGEPLVFNQPSPLRPGMIASNGLLHDGLLALVREVGAPEER